MSPVHGKQGQPYARPVAPSQNQSQWGQASQGTGSRIPQAGQSQAGQSQAGQSQAGQSQAGQSQAGQSQAGQSQAGQPQAHPQAHPQQTPGYQNSGYPDYGAAGNATTNPSLAQPGFGQPQPSARQLNSAAQQLGGNAGHQPPYGGGYGEPDYSTLSSTPTTGGYPASNSYAPQFEPLTPAPAMAVRTQQTAPQPQRAVANSHGYAPSAQGYDYAPQTQYYSTPQGYTAPHAPQGYPQQHANPGWGAPQQADQRGFDLGTYSPSHQPQPAYEGPETQYAHEPQFGAEPQFAPQVNQWADHGDGGHAAEHGGYAQEGYAQGGYEGGYDQGYGQAGPDYANQTGADLGFGQPAGGELDQSYVEEEDEYEEEAPSRARRPMLMAAVLAGAIMFGGGMTYGYRALFGGSSAGDPPIIKSAVEPSKFKPADGGGKQFAHTDSKIMGRLGDGSATAGAEAASDNSGDIDGNGTRKVSTLVVGRDGSIQAPAPDEPTAPPSTAVRVPGLTIVDGLGATGPARAPRTINAPAPEQKPVTVAKVAPPPAPTGSIEPEVAAEPAPEPAAAKKTTAAKPPATIGSTSVATTGSGFVAVLASVPRSNSSRMDALKRFADMQQKYASVLSGKTPDVAEANLGAKGSYHRLVVGPPGSREQASSVCAQLKTQGYNDCWVTTY